LHNLVNIVDVRDSPAVSFLAASEGHTVPEHGELRSGSASAARLDIGAGGMVRLGPLTSLGMELLGGTDSDPLTRLKLTQGQLWGSLSRGQFEAQTPMGVAAVRGSYAQLQYYVGTDPNSVKDD